MKNLVILISTLFLALSLTACASTGMSGGTTVKCPACGAEFEPGR